MDPLKLENQICFPLYAAARLVIREYQPLLERLGLTYPQYLVLLVLWEQDGLSVNEITRRLLLETSTLTPLLKRMEAQGWLTRRRSPQDERRVIVRLTPEGKALRAQAAAIPEQLVAGLTVEGVTGEDLRALQQQLYAIITFLSQKGAVE